MSSKTEFYKGYMNRVCLIGQLKEVPTINKAQDGTSVATIRLLTKYQSKNKDTGEPCEVLDWHRVVLYGKKADDIARIARKGIKLQVEGPIHYKKYDNKEVVEIVATRIQAQEKIKNSQGTLNDEA